MAGKAKLSLEQIKAFNIAAVKFETQGADKSLEDVDKIVNALSQINSTEVWNSSSPDISDLLFNCGQLIQVLDYKCGTTWNLISLLNKIRDSSILCQKAGQLLPVLARLLHSIPSTTHNRTVKLLDLLQYIVQDYEVLYMEKFIAAFLQDLLKFISGDDEKMRFMSAVILSSLLRKNILVVKMLLTLHNQDELVNITDVNNPTSLIMETILVRREQMNLFVSVPPDTVLMRMLEQISTYLRICYREGDRLMFNFFKDFIQDISENIAWKEALNRLNGLDVISSFLAIPAFEGQQNPDLWDSYFSFLSPLISFITGDSLNILTNVIKVVLSRLECKPFNGVKSALELLLGALQGLQQVELTPEDKRNLRFLLEPLLPCLQNVFLLQNQDDRGRDCLCTCLQLLSKLVSLDKALVPLNITPEHARTVFIKEFGECSASKVKCTIAVELVSYLHVLSTSFRADSSSWSKVENELLESEDVIASVKEALTATDLDPEVAGKALKIISANTDKFLPKHREAKPQLYEERHRMNVDGVDPLRLESLMEDLRLATSTRVGDSDERILSQALQLQLSLGQREQTQIKVLRSSLEASNESARNLTLVVSSLSQELEEVKLMLNLVSARYSAGQEELASIRTQQLTYTKDTDFKIEELTRELSRTKQHMQKEIENSAARIAEEQENNKKMLEKMRQERDQLMTESDQKLAELKAALTKSHDKLRKTMKLLEEEQARREVVEKKNEKLEKREQSLDTLTRNQEEALNKKEKLLQDAQRELHELKTIRDAIFNLSKAGPSAPGST